MKILKYAFLSLCLILTLALLLLFVFMAYEEGRITEAGFSITYSKQDELDTLMEKFTTTGVDKTESKRLDWLLKDQNMEANAQLDAYLKGEKKKGEMEPE